MAFLSRSAQLAALIVLSIPSLAAAFQCNICHSRNPAMVAMHRATEAKGIGCFDCHRVGDKLMGKGESKDRGTQLVRRGTDPVCAGCHAGKAAR